MRIRSVKLTDGSLILFKRTGMKVFCVDNGFYYSFFGQSPYTYAGYN